MNWIQEKANLEKQICCLKEQIANMTPSGVVVPTYQREVFIGGALTLGTPGVRTLQMSICDTNVPNISDFNYNWDGVAVVDVYQALVDYLNTDFAYLGVWSLVGGIAIVLDGTQLLACPDGIVLTVLD